MFGNQSHGKFKQIKFVDYLQRSKDAVLERIIKIPAFYNVIKELNSEEIYKVVIPKEYLRKLKEGTSYLIQTDSGNFFPTIVNKDTNRYEKHLEVQLVEKDLIAALDNLAIQQSLSNILSRLDDIGQKINRILKGQQNDRIALANSAYQQFIEAMNIEDSNLKQMILVNVLKTANDAREQLVQNFNEDILFLRNIPDSDENFKLIVEQIKNSKFKSDVEERVAELYRSYDSINMVSGILAYSYHELKQHQNILLSLNPYRDLLDEIVKDDETLKKLYSYHDDPDLASIWSTHPIEMLKKLENPSGFFNDEVNPKIEIEFKAENLLRLVG